MKRESVDRFSGYTTRPKGLSKQRGRETDMQRRLVSFLEALFNTGVGFGLSIGVGVVVYPLFGHKFSIPELTGITTIFTLVSILRGYVVRRLFNWMHIKGWR